MDPSRISFLLDEQVASALATALRHRGIDALTLHETEIRGKPDPEVLAFARANERVVVTHDADFLRLHQAGVEHSGIAYAHQGTKTIGQILETLTLMYQVLSPDDMRNRREFL